MYFYCSISWHHKPVRVRSHVAFLAFFSCAICYFGVLLKGWCCYCTCESKTDRRGMLCQYEMPKHGLHFKLIFSRLKLMFFTRFLDLSRVSKWHLMTALLGRAGFGESFRYWSTLPFYSFSFHPQLSPAFLMELSLPISCSHSVPLACYFLLILCPVFCVFFFFFPSSP